MKIKKSSVDQVKEEQSGAYISSRLRNPGDEVVATSDGKDTIYGIIAIVATLISIGIAVALYLDLDKFQSSGLFVQ